MEVLIFIGVIEAIACGFYTSNVAYNKGYSQGAWFWGGAIFNLLALIAICGYPINEEALKQRRKREREEEKQKEQEKQEEELRAVEEIARKQREVEEAERLQREGRHKQRKDGGRWQF